jgi:hypothetical protein
MGLQTVSFRHNAGSSNAGAKFPYGRDKVLWERYEMMMRQEIGKKLPLIVLLALSACASTGTKVDQSTFASFEKGKSTCSE